MQVMSEEVELYLLSVLIIILLMNLLFFLHIVLCDFFKLCNYNN